MALPDRELWHMLSDPSDKAVGLTSTEKINNNRRPLFFFFFLLKNYFCADFFTSWNTSYCFSVLCDFWLNGSLSVCITEVFSFFGLLLSLGYSEAVFYDGYSWNFEQLCRFELHIYGEKWVVFQLSDLICKS